MSKEYHKLDNPAWYALTETHAAFAIGNTVVKRYRPDVVAFTAYQTGNESVQDQFDQLIQQHEPFFIIGDLPQLPAHYSLLTRLACEQMVCSAHIPAPITETIIPLGEANEDEVYELINLVQPGYYKHNTRLMGDYFGIRFEGRLVAVTGERMRMDGFTEISAVVTHPDFAGRGFAKQLVAFVSNKNLEQGIVPFLHVAQSNERAIRLYQYLGFSRRRSIDFTKFCRQ
ncbi:MAG: GNAT family N-acetyltransferase [Sediminibacterium magnilacihabitans]|jgi:predicted GNAT family acetyltransferase|nr:GNAT family N-acetyltransferase [Sediminibacterium magnilacihabitans]PQV59777.1 FR47-like protein [Sediminibacterium magnilacihabitans]